MSFDSFIMSLVLSAIIVGILYLSTRKTPTAKEARWERERLAEGDEVASKIQSAFETLLLNRDMHGFELDASYFLGTSDGQDAIFNVDTARLPFVNYQHYYYMRVPQEQMEMFLFPIGRGDKARYIYLSRKRRERVMSFGTNYKAPGEFSEAEYRDYTHTQPDVVGMLYSVDQLLRRCGLPSINA